MSVWFGRPWPSGVCEDPESTRVETPLGAPCLFCDELIDEGDRGLGMGGGWAHAECMLRQVTGGPAHLLGLCGCSGGGEDPDLGMNPREASRWVWRYVEVRGEST